MSLRRTLPAAFGMLLCTYAAWAQDSLPGPAEVPPAGFAADTYVDSDGCGFLRVLVGGQQVWAPRYRMDGTQLCGLQPSFAAQGAGGGEASPESPTQTAESPAEPSEPAEEGGRAPGYYVQAGAFGLRQNALGVRDGFIAQGWGAETQPAGRLTAVFAGPFADEEAAEAALVLIRRDGMPDAFVFLQE